MWILDRYPCLLLEDGSKLLTDFCSHFTAGWIVAQGPTAQILVAVVQDPESRVPEFVSCPDQVVIVVVVQLVAGWVTVRGHVNHLTM